MLKDIRYAYRALRQNAGFALTAIISIALAIGVNAAAFSLVDGLIFRPLPVRDVSRVVSLRMISPSSTATSIADTGMALSYPDYVDFRNNSRSFDGLIAYALKAAGYALDEHGEHSQARLKMGYTVSGNFFQVLGVDMALGRAFTPEEDAVPERDAVVVLANDFWMQEFAGNRSVIGSRIRLNGTNFTVIGVAPESFTGLDQFTQPAFFVPFMMAPKFEAKEDLRTRDYRDIGVKGRLKPGVTLEAASAEISAIEKSLEQSHPVTNKGFGAAVRTENQIRLDNTPAFAALVIALFTLVTVVLLIACSNVANLVLARGGARAREFAVRLAIGAGRFRLIRQLMAENLIIAICGGGLGLLFAQFAVGYFSSLDVVADEPVKLSFEIDHRVLLFTLLVSVASAILFGLAPALHVTKTDLGPALKAGAVRHGRKHFFGRNALVVVQIAGSLVLLLAAVGAYTVSAASLANRGFRIDHLLTTRLDTEVAGYKSKQSQQFYKLLADRTPALPGVKSVALTSSIPLTSMLQLKTLIPEGYSFPPGQSSVSIFSSTVDEHYFEVLGIPLLRGRGFLPTDSANSPRVAIVNEAFATKYLGTDPIGKRIRLEGENGPWVQVVGITATGKYVSIMEQPTGFLYLPLSQEPQARLTMLVESYEDPAMLAAPVRELVRSMDSNVPILSVLPMQELFYRSFVETLHLVISMFAATGLIGFILALVGLYGVVAYQAARRTREIGIRMALGAERQQVMSMVLKHAATVGVIGIIIGLILSQALKAALSGAGGTAAQSGPTVFMFVIPTALLLTVLAAAAIPARRASRIDPMMALREE
jgi:predicted permease